jgi:hypothetical protein
MGKPKKLDSEQMKQGMSQSFEQAMRDEAKWLKLVMSFEKRSALLIEGESQSVS